MDSSEWEKELADVNKRLETIRGYNQTLRLEAEKAELLRKLGRDREAEILEAYIKEYQ